MYKLMRVILVIVLVLVLSLISGCSGENTKVEYDEKFVRDFDVEDNVKSIVAREVLGIYETYVKDFPDYQYSDWRIIDLELVYQYEELEGLNIDVYRVGFELLSLAPEKVMLVGGMYMTDDHWVCPTYPNSTYFIFKVNESNNEKEFMFSMMENDCSPGSETFTTDLIARIQTENQKGE